MGLIVYGHDELDAVTRDNGLGYAGSDLNPAAWPMVLADLAPAWFRYSAAQHGRVVVVAGTNTRTSPTSGDAETFTRFAVAAVEAIRDDLAKDTVRQETYGGDALKYLGLEISCGAGTAAGETSVPDGTVIATIVIKLPQRVDVAAWPVLPKFVQRESTTRVATWTLDQAARAWDAIA